MDMEDLANLSGTRVASTLATVLEEHVTYRVSKWTFKASYIHLETLEHPCFTAWHGSRMYQGNWKGQTSGDARLAVFEGIWERPPLLPQG